jgi:hypothetical protein
MTALWYAETHKKRCLRLASGLSLIFALVSRQVRPSGCGRRYGSSSLCSGTSGLTVTHSESGRFESVVAWCSLNDSATLQQRKVWQSYLFPNRRVLASSLADLVNSARTTACVPISLYREEDMVKRFYMYRIVIIKLVCRVMEWQR